MRMHTVLLSGVAALIWAASPAQADITVGFVTALSGSGSSIGIPYAKGIAAGHTYQDQVGSEKVRVVQLDDGSDPSTAARNARKLIEEDKADIIIGTSSTPSSSAMAAVATEQKVPMIAISPFTEAAPGPSGRWVWTSVQSIEVMIAAVVNRMKKDSIKKIGYIGFSDSWGDLVYNDTIKAAKTDGITVQSNERYARADTSVTAQVLKILALDPDGVMTGGSGTPGALPYIALSERGYRGRLYGPPSLINADFIRVGGKSVEGVIASTGPVVVAEQLPDSNPSKKVSLAFRDAYKKANGVPTTDAFSGYAFDAWLIMLDASKRALAHAKPGTAEFRTAMRDAVQSTKELVGTQGVFNYSAASAYGTDSRSVVLVKLVNGAWKLEP